MISNNPSVYQQYNTEVAFLYQESYTFIDVLRVTRDMIHKGHKLLTHPLSGSIKPYETPYKTILVTKETVTLDLDSLHMIEDAITTTEKFIKNIQQRKLNTKTLQDFQMIDLSLIEDSMTR